MISFQNTVNRVITGLISFFVGIRARPVVGFLEGPDRCELLAAQFQDRMQSIYANYKEISDASPASSKALLLILTRASDPYSPLLHQFTYEALAREEKTVTNDAVSIPNSRGMSFVSLNFFEDKIFQEIRYLMNYEAGDRLSKLNKPIADLERAADSEKNPQAKADLLRRLARMRNDREAIANHVTLADNLAQIISAKQLVSLAEFEQAVVTEVREERSFHPRLVELEGPLGKLGPSEIDKIRLLALYNLKAEKKITKDEDLVRIMQSCGIGMQYKPVVWNVMRLTKPYDRSAKDCIVKGAKTLKADKWVPLIHDVTAQAVDGKLSSKKFSLPPDYKECRTIVVFMMGGISYMELRWLENVRQNAKGRSVFVGATDIVTPVEFVSRLQRL
jgi:hypothetical protein